MWVLNGTSDSGRGARARRLPRVPRAGGIRAAPAAAGAVPANTTIVAYNGAETKLPATIAYLEKTFGVTVTLVTDPAIRADIIVTIGKDDARPRGAALVLTRGP